MKDTQIHPEDLEPVAIGSADVTWAEIEDENVILNPDAESMGSRG